MKTSVLIFLILSVSHLFGQDTNSTKNNSKSFLIGVNFSPDFNYRAIHNNDGSDINNIIISSRNDRETAKLGYTFGLNSIYKLNKRFAFGAGLQFSNKGYRSVSSGFVFGNIVDPRQGFVITPNDPSIPESFEQIYRFYYLDMPIKGILTFGNKKIRLITSLGITTNILIKSSTLDISNFSDGSTTKSTQAPIDKSSNFNFSPLISIGGEIKIKNNSFIRIEPTFRYQILSNIDAPITENLWNAGINISYFLKLK